jgi:hypothetical protein
MPWRPIGLWDAETSIFSEQSANRWRWGCKPYVVVGLHPQDSVCKLGILWVLRVQIASPDMKGLEPGLHGLMTKYWPIVLLECFWTPEHGPVPHPLGGGECVSKISFSGCVIARWWRRSLIILISLAMHYFIFIIPWQLEPAYLRRHETQEFCFVTFRSVRHSLLTRNYLNVFGGS